MKFNFKQMLGSVKEPAMGIGLITAGVIGSQKFFDFKAMFPNVDPNKWYIKHEGAIKVGGVLVTFMIWKKMPSWAKYLLMGIAIQGAIKEIRVLTMGDNGKAFVDQIGNENSNKALEELAAQVREAAAMNGAEDEGTGVGAQEPETGVAGMGVAGLGGGMGQVWEVYQPTGTY